jgi:hypothetical protein
MQGRYETRMLYNVLTCLLTAIGSSSATKGKPHTHKFWRRRRSTWAAVTTILCRQPHDKAMLWNFFNHGSPFAYRGYDSAIYHLTLSSMSRQSPSEGRVTKPMAKMHVSSVSILVARLHDTVLT